MNCGEARRFTRKRGFRDGIEGCWTLLIANILQADLQPLAAYCVNRMGKGEVRLQLGSQVLEDTPFVTVSVAVLGSDSYRAAMLLSVRSFALSRRRCFHHSIKPSAAMKRSASAVLYV